MKVVRPGIKQSRSGMTMIEVMTAVGIIAIALLALLSILIFAFKAQVKSEKAHAASLIAKTLLNESANLLDQDFDRTTLTPPLPGPGLVPYPSMEDYSVQIVLTPETANLKRVEVQVNWEDSNGDQTETTCTKFLRSAR
jgi:prepilin-type N-terminal cleavage/methylation domain-containing protein